MPKWGQSLRKTRHLRIRKKVQGTTQRPRMAVFRSLNHIYVQVIDDSRGATLVSASSLDGDVKESANGKAKADVSALVGALIAKRASDGGIKTVVFDRGGYKYHGRVKALAEAARKGGLTF